MTVHLGLGANSGDPSENLERALASLATLLSSMRASPVFRTRPMYLEAQPDFLNCAVQGQTELEPRMLLEALQRIEASLGRNRAAETRMGKRPIDIDILLYGAAIVREDDLILPHPRLLERKFALLPLLCLSPDARHPVTGRPLAEAFEALPDQGIYYSSLHGYSCFRHDE